MSQATINPNVNYPGALGPGNAVGALYGDSTGGLLVTENMPHYSRATNAGKLFHAYAAGVTATTVGTGMVGLQIWNSAAAGGNNLHICGVWCCVLVNSAATSVVIATGSGQTAAPTGQTAITRQSCGLLGASNGNGLAYNAGTFANAPTALIPIMHNTVAIATTGEDIGSSFIDLGGALVIPPQFYVCFAMVGAAAGTSGFNGYMSWMELPPIVF